MAYLRPTIWLNMSEDDVKKLSQEDFVITSAVSAKVKAEIVDAISEGVEKGVAMIINQIFGGKGGQQNGR